MSLRHGAKYLESLRDGREVWFQGRRVADVTAEPGLAACAQSLADTFDRQHDPALRDTLTMVSATTEERVSLAYLLPRTQEDLVRRRRMAEYNQRRTGGVTARLPGHQACLLVGLHDGRDILAEADPGFATSLEAFFEHCRENDLCLAPCFGEPPRSQNVPPAGPQGFRVVERRADGIVVRGSKNVSTLAPYADMFLGLSPNRPGLAADEIVYFATPVNTPGIRLVCRQPFGHASGADHPLSAYYDEMDAWVIFNDVFIPNQWVFYLEHLERNAELFGRALAWASYDNLLRMAVKADALAGICLSITDYLGTKRGPLAAPGLVEAISYAETLWSFVNGAERDAITSASGLLMPNPTQVLLGRLHGVARQPQVLQIVRELSGSGLLMAPGETEMSVPELREDIDRHLVGADARAPDRFRMLKLAWEYACESFGSRQLLFEMYNESPLAVNQARLLNSYDSTRVVSLAKSLAGIEDGAT